MLPPDFRACGAEGRSKRVRTNKWCVLGAEGAK
jgi:hypothetical protein